MLRARLMAAAVLLVPVLALLWLDTACNFGVPGLWLAPLGLGACVMVAAETCQLMRQAPSPPRRWSAISGAAVVVVATLVPYLLARWLPDNCPLEHWGWTALGLALALLLVFVPEMLAYRQPGEAVVRLALTWFVVCYAGLSISFLFAVRLAIAPDLGMAALFSLLWVVKLADVGAYFTGRLLGRRQLSPLLSPKKTYEGAVGGLVAAGLASWLALNWLLPWWLGSAHVAPSVLAQLGYGISLALAGMLGDLGESLLKRDMQCKDSSRWLPGLGGMLDVMDSVLFAAPVGFLWWASGWLQPGVPH